MKRVGLMSRIWNIIGGLPKDSYPFVYYNDRANGGYFVKVLFAPYMNEEQVKKISELSPNIYDVHFTSNKSWFGIECHLTFRTTCKISQMVFND